MRKQLRAENPASNLSQHNDCSEKQKLRNHQFRLGKRCDFANLARDSRASLHRPWKNYLEQLSTPASFVGFAVFAG